MMRYLRSTSRQAYLTAAKDKAMRQKKEVNDSEIVT